jgi:enoyl-[acyl-carrier-protein] reductase (NADH)
VNAIAAAIFLVSDSASSVTGTILPVDEFLASGVNQVSFRNTRRQGADQA